MSFPASHAKCRPAIPRIFALIAAALLCGAISVFGQTVYWDINGNASGAGGGTAPAGTWSTSVANWNTTSGGGSGGTISSWVNGRDAVFSAGTNATGSFTVTVSGTVGVSSINVGEGTINFTGGTINFSDASPDFTVGTGLTATVGSVISGSNGLTKAGSGTLTLSGANTFSGNTTINAGALVAANNTALGTSTFGNTIASGGALHLQGGITLNEGSFSVAGTGVSNTGALRNLTGNNALTAALTLTGNTTIASDAGTLTLSGQVNLGSTAGLNALTVTGAGNTTFTGSIHDTGSITKTGTGTLTFSGSTGNTFSGGLNINSGTVIMAKTGGTYAAGGGNINVGDGVGTAGSAVLQYNASNQLPNYTTLLTVNSDGKLALNGFAQTLDKIAGTGQIDLGTGGYLGVGLNSGSSTFGGSLTGTGTVEKLGAGTLTITSDISNSNATLALSGGTLQLSNADLVLGTLNVTANSIIDFAGTASTLNLTNLSIAAGVTLTILNWQAAVDFFASTNWTGAIHGVAGSSPMNQIIFSGFSGNDTRWLTGSNEITPYVPEPSTYGALMLFLLTGAVGVRKFLLSKK